MGTSDLSAVWNCGWEEATDAIYDAVQQSALSAHNSEVAGGTTGYAL